MVENEAQGDQGKRGGKMNPLPTEDMPPRKPDYLILSIAIAIGAVVFVILVGYFWG